MEKTQKRIYVKWVRSGIGFTYRQKELVRSLGLARLHQTVKCEDTPQNRGIVAKIPHMVEIVNEPSVPAWAKVPEYTIYLPEPAAVEQPRVVRDTARIKTEQQVAVAGGEEVVVSAPETADSAKLEKTKRRAKAVPSSGKAKERTKAAPAKVKTKAKQAATKDAKHPKPAKKGKK